MTIKVRWIAAMSGEEARTTGSAVLTYEAYDTNRTAFDSDNESVYDGYINSLFAAVLARAPTVWRELYREKIAFREDDNRNGRFFFDLTYSFAPPESNRRWSFDTTGGNFKVTVSRGTTRYAPAGMVAPDFKSAIEVKDGKAEGVEIVLPALKLTCTYRHAAGVYDDSYIKTLAALSGTVNLNDWLTYKAGELLFLGANGEYTPGKPFEIQYQFAASQNVTGLTLGGITDIAKKGHEYIWVLFEPKQDAAANNFVVQRPRAVYVERLYEASDFNILGIHE